MTYRIIVFFAKLDYNINSDRSQIIEKYKKWNLTGPEQDYIFKL